VGIGTHTITYAEILTIVRTFAGDDLEVLAHPAVTFVAADFILMLVFNPGF
jgi:hypothetical protein